MYRVSEPGGRSKIIELGDGDGWNAFTNAACEVLGITPELLASRLGLVIDPLEPGLLPNRAVEAGLVRFENLDEDDEKRQG